jgi:alpha-glucosidase
VSRRAADWWRGAVVYQVYPRSFADSNGDGIGDLLGIVERLDYIASLGVDAIWLNPITPSPDADWGYDVSDYCGVHPDFGTLDDLGRLVREADGRGLALVLDLVPNHTSDRHPWFLDSRSSRSSAHRDWYVWADGRDGGPPNNWVSVFGGRAWTRDEATGQWYLHNFLPEQPDLNWWNEDVRAAFDAILRFWFERGVAGFRIDVAHGIVKDRELRDNPPARPDDPEILRRHGQRPLHNFNQPEVHDVIKRWRRVADAEPGPPILVGETWAPDIESLARFYGNGDDELQLAFNFDLPTSPFDVELRSIAEATEASLPPGCLPAWTMSNHDLARAATRWCDGDDAKIRCALLMLLGLRGTIFLYYGDELGMPQADVPAERRLDEGADRDGARTPMVWSAGDRGGFTRPGVEPWLPPDTSVTPVDEQRGDPGSVLSFTRRLVELRRTSADLRAGSYETVASPDGVWAWKRGERTLVAVNLSDGVPDFRAAGTVALATTGQREGDRANGRLRLAPWEGAILVSDAH